MHTKHQIDNLDRSILELLSHDARIPYLEIARANNVAGSTIHQRVKKLEEMGIIKGTKIVVDSKQLGYVVCAFIGIYLEKASMFNTVDASLRAINEVVECHYTTGVYSIFAKIYCRDTEHLRDILNNQIQVIEGVQRTETFISLGQPFERNLLF